MRKYNHLIILFLLTLLILAAVFGIYYFYQKIQHSLDTQERTSLEQEIQTNRIKNLPELATRYQAIIANEPYFSLVYPEDKVVEVIKDMERLAKDYDVTLTITQKEVSKKKVVKKETSDDEKNGDDATAKAPKELVDTLPYEKSIMLELKAEGRYLALRKFLHAIETAPYALDVLALTGSVAPVDTDAAPVSQPAGESPFLLSNADSATTVPVADNPSKIIFLMDVALYIQ